MGWQLPREEVKDQSRSFCFSEVRKPPGCALSCRHDFTCYTNMLKGRLFWSQKLTCLHLVDMKLQTVDLELRCHDAMDQLPSRLPWQFLIWGAFEEITKELHIEIVKQKSWASNKTSARSTLESLCGFLAQEEIHPHNVVEVDGLPSYSRSTINAHVPIQSLSPC